MDTQALAAALRNKAAEVKNINVESQDDYNLLRDASDLLRVLAQVVDGKSLEKAFGAPGDWGYETQIGQAIASATKPTSPPSALNEAMRQDVEAEREACAKLCESIDAEAFGVIPARAVIISDHCAKAIRERSNARSEARPACGTSRSTEELDGTNEAEKET